MSRCDAAGESQPKARPPRPPRDERIENPRGKLRRDARTVVRDFNEDYRTFYSGAGGNGRRPRGAGRDSVVVQRVKESARESRVSADPEVHRVDRVLPDRDAGGEVGTG